MQHEFRRRAGRRRSTIAPEGGCPGNFYTSRKWTFEQDALVIRDHNGQPLGQLALAAPAASTARRRAGSR